MWKEEVRHRRTKGDGGVVVGEGQRHQVSDRPQSSQDMRHEPDQDQGQRERDEDESDEKDTNGGDSKMNPKDWGCV